MDIKMLIASIIVCLAPIGPFVYWFWLYRSQKKKYQKELPPGVMLYHEISEAPYEISKEECYEADIKDSNQKYLFIDHSYVNKFLKYFGFGLAVYLIFATILCDPLISGKYAFVGYYIQFYIIVILVLVGLSGYINYKNYFLFDRQKQTLTYIDKWFKERTIPFSEVKFIFGSNKLGDEYLGVLRSDNVTWTNISFGNVPAIKVHAIFIWYMDKNRPLPPGTAFDRFREKDYELRKEEGFPTPLYPSRIAMVDYDGDTNRYKPTTS